MLFFSRGRGAPHRCNSDLGFGGENSPPGARGPLTPRNLRPGAGHGARKAGIMKRKEREKGLRANQKTPFSKKPTETGAVLHPTRPHSACNGERTLGLPPGAGGGVAPVEGGRRTTGTPT